MTDGLSVLSKLFGNFGEAIIAVRGGQIICFNETAAMLVPDIASMKPEEILPPDLTERPEEEFTGEADVKGVKRVVRVSHVAGCRIYSIAVPEGVSDDVGNLLSSVGIELKNILSVLKMASELLLPHIENIGNPRLNRYTSMIYHCYYNMLRITNNLSDLGGIIREDTPISPSSFDIVAAGQELLSSIRHLVRESGVEFRLESNEDSLLVYADRVRLDKLMLNLISNSLLNTKEGGIVVLSVMSAGDRFIIAVGDNGSGIPGDVMTTAWNRFNVPKELSGGNTGVGLGLTIIQNIAKLHGGSAVMESRPGSGTTVTVSIPLKTPEADSFKTHVVSYDGRDMQQLLTELSGVIGYDKYTQLYMD